MIRLSGDVDLNEIGKDTTPNAKDEAYCTPFSPIFFVAVGIIGRLNGLPLVLNSDTWKS